MSLNPEVEEGFIARKARDAEEYLDCASRPFDQAQGRRVRGENAEEKVGLLRSE